MQQIIVILLSVCLFISCSKDGKTEAVKTELKQIDTIPMIVTRIQQCSKLYTTEYHIHKVITHSDKMKFSGSVMKKDFSIDLPIGQRRIAIPMDAAIKAYIDFGTFSEKSIRRKGREIMVILPDPKIVITSTRINHKDVKQYVALTRSSFSDEELSDYELQGRKQIEDAIPEMGIIENTRQNAARILIPLFVSMGYKESDIIITFRQPFPLDDFRRLIVNSNIEKNG